MVDEELTRKALEYLHHTCPQCRFKDRWVFVYASYVTDCSSSVEDFQEITSAVVDTCQMSGVGVVWNLLQWQWETVTYIDDIGVKRGGINGVVCGKTVGSPNAWSSG